jgi:hypothetical protein
MAVHLYFINECCPFGAYQTGHAKLLRKIKARLGHLQHGVGRHYGPGKHTSISRVTKPMRRSLAPTPPRQRHEEVTMGLLATLLGHATDVTPEETREDLEGILLPDEPVEVAFKVVRDLFVFTDKRLILVDKQGLTSRKVDYLVVPYRAITSYSIETAGTLDMDSELKIWISGRAEPIQKTLKRGANIRGIQAAIAAAL